ncbi:hypothetical protein IAU60_002603 [Kwoniella sp. DSM 27419]
MAGEGLGGPKRASLRETVTQHLNFFRVHILVFTFTPIIFACILYAANGSATGNANSTRTGTQKVTFVDSLFLCYSAMTTCGLVTVNISALHPFQQVLLFLLFIVGDPSFVSLVMVLVRKRYFRTHCERLLQNDRLRRTQSVQPVLDRPYLSRNVEDQRTKEKSARGPRYISGPLDPRLHGRYVEDLERADTDSPATTSEGVDKGSTTDPSLPSSLGRSAEPLLDGSSNDTTPRPPSDGQTQGYTTALSILASPTITFDPHQATYNARQRLRQQTRTRTMSVHDPALERHLTFDTAAVHPRLPAIPLRMAATSPVTVLHPQYTHTDNTLRRKHSGFGGFPTPLEIVRHWLPERAKQRLSQPVKLEIVRSTTYAPFTPDDHPSHANDETWANKLRGSVAHWMPAELAGLVVGRNSRFWTEELDDTDLEQIGGVEYRALRLLSYLVAGYIFLCQAIPFAILAIYFAKVNKYDAAFQPQAGVQAGQVNKTWFSLFISVSGYTGSGMSLTDQGLAPFATSYTLIYVLIFVLLAGNHALPIMLRSVLWLGTKITRQGRTFETLHFLLDHPRRCFLYLFPSHQTWYLVFILVAFIAIELFSFLVLNIGLPVLDSLGGWQRFSDGLLQSLSVRASGFGIVAIGNMSPSVLFIYVILMYVAIYPIAMSVRSTNVYEEQALGVYEHDASATLGEDEPQFKGRKHEVFSKYLLWHMRRQLAFDIWPLAVAIFLICCFERGKLLDPAKQLWFNIFRVLFECTSAYSVIGLSLGTPNNNYSFSGEFGTVSKLVIMVVMLRGRHRGLPVAIDRAILLPTEYSRIGKQPDEKASE